MIDVDMFSKHLYTRYYPDPDLLIRTSGEMRLSNFLLWQLSYTEMYVTPKLWPDFTKKDLFDAVEDFGSRNRRYGAV
jgi:undecaprenyl diphosphate synthase